jgi:anti-anti-sigma factor
MNGSAQGGVTVDREGRVWIVTLTGEHDLATVERLRDTLGSLLSSETQPLTGRVRVVIDLSVVEFIDSSTVNAMLWAQDEAKLRPDAELVLVEPPAGGAVARTVEMLDLGSIMTIYHTRGQAVPALDDQIEQSGA